MAEEAQIRQAAIVELLSEARRNPQQECCGFLAGRDGVMTTVLPAVNALESATQFEIAPAELFRLVREMRAHKLEHLGIYHSHPTGENVPSARDIERAFYPETAYFILSPGEDTPRPLRAFSIHDGRVSEIAIEVVNP